MRRYRLSATFLLYIFSLRTVAFRTGPQLEWTTRYDRNSPLREGTIREGFSVDDGVPNAYSSSVKGGCVANVEAHIRLLDKSLESSSGMGIFRRINDMLWQDVEGASSATRSNSPSSAPQNITTAQELDRNERFGILSHGIQEDPIYNYGNRASLELFEQTLDVLCRTPSRYSTVPSLMDDRGRLIEQIEQVGHGTIPNAVRTSAKGKLFVMQTIWVWTVYAFDREGATDGGRRIGLAALYDRSQVKPYTGSPP